MFKCYIAIKVIFFSKLASDFNTGALRIKEHICKAVATMLAFQLITVKCQLTLLLQKDVILRL